MFSPAKSLARGKLMLRTVSAVVGPGMPIMTSSRRKGIVRADDAAEQVLKNRKHLKQVDFTDEQADMLLQTFISTTDLVKKSDLDLRTAELSSKIDLCSAELGLKIDLLNAKMDSKIDLLNAKMDSKIDLLNAKMDSKIDLLNAKMENVLIVVVVCGLLLASPEGLANSFAGRLVAALLSILVK